MPFFETLLGLFHGGRHHGPGAIVELPVDVAKPLLESKTIKPTTVEQIRLPPIVDDVAEAKSKQPDKTAPPSAKK